MKHDLCKFSLPGLPKRKQETPFEKKLNPSQLEKENV